MLCADAGEADALTDGVVDRLAAAGFASRVIG